VRSRKAAWGPRSGSGHKQLAQTVPGRKQNFLGWEADAEQSAGSSRALHTRSLVPFRGHILQRMGRRRQSMHSAQSAQCTEAKGRRSGCRAESFRDERASLLRRE
jgi:hypothetical protein